jgi:hypothetical protein
LLFGDWDLGFHCLIEPSDSTGIGFTLKLSSSSRWDKICLKLR